MCGHANPCRPDIVTRKTKIGDWIELQGPQRYLSAIFCYCKAALFRCQRRYMTTAATHARLSVIIRMMHACPAYVLVVRIIHGCLSSNPLSLHPRSVQWGLRRGFCGT